VASFIYLSNIDRKRFLRPSRASCTKKKKIEDTVAPRPRTFLSKESTLDIMLANGIGNVVDTFKQRTQATDDNG